MLHGNGNDGSIIKGIWLVVTAQQWEWDPIIYNILVY